MNPSAGLTTTTTTRAILSYRDEGYWQVSNDRLTLRKLYTPGPRFRTADVGSIGIGCCGCNSLSFSQDNGMDDYCWTTGDVVNQRKHTYIHKKDPDCSSPPPIHPLSLVKETDETTQFLVNVFLRVATTIFALTTLKGGWLGGCGRRESCCCCVEHLRLHGQMR